MVSVIRSKVHDHHGTAAVNDGTYGDFTVKFELQTARSHVTRYKYTDSMEGDRALECLKRFYSTPYPGADRRQLYCNSTDDSLSCWPTTVAGTLASIPCPRFIEGIPYNTSKNVTKWCLPTGRWERLANYSQCEPLQNIDEISEIADGETEKNIVVTIYFVGFGISLLALCVALSIFLHFRSLRCIRNKVHCHLIATFILRTVAWIMLTSIMGTSARETAPWWLCTILTVIHNYLQMTNFFWMFVEGLYLHTIIVWAYSAEKIRFWHYAMIGWCAPCILIVSWAVVKYMVDNNYCWLPKTGTYYDYIYIAPILICLGVNIIFLGSIIWVLITKLRASNTLETRRYRKAVRATLILLPLLGLTYVLFITPPSQDTTVKAVFAYFNAVLQSTQGLWVSVFYCFLNSEVRAAISKRFSDWQDTKTLSTRYVTRGNSVAGSNSPARSSTQHVAHAQTIPLTNGSGGGGGGGGTGTHNKKDRNCNESDNDSPDGRCTKKTPLIQENSV